MIHALHGALGHSSDWRPIASRLAASGHQTKSVDLWRFLDCCSLSLEKTAAAINQEAKTDKDPSRILLGYSMGGRLALHALIDDPSLWSAAILIAPHTGLNTQALRSERLKADATWASRALDAPWPEFLDEWNQQGVLADTPTPDRHFLKQRRRAIALSFTAWSLGMQGDLLPQLSDIKCPVLWITGTEDQKFTPIARRAAALMPSASHQVIEEAGHRLIFSHPEPTAALIDSFLRAKS